MNSSTNHDARKILRVGFGLLTAIVISLIAFSGKTASTSSPDASKLRAIDLPSAAPVDTSHETGIRFSRLTSDLPLSFEANMGQTDSHVRFVSRGSGYGLFLTSTAAAVLQLHTQSSTGKSRPDMLSLTLEGANAQVSVKGVDQLPGRQNYFIGNDPK